MAEEEFSGKIKLDGTIYKKPEEFYINLNISAILNLSCDRCLKTFKSDFRANIYLVYTKDENLLGKNQNDDVKLISDSTNEIDITEDIKEYIELEKPLKAVCRDDCKGLCTQCGTDLNLRSCDCKNKNIDSRWSDLKEIKIN
ncbi:DUF177 domain-containing protein [candidate division KSB1 bacterium]